jgi:ADP-heptose:LPS heptosyltransferase
MNVGKLGAMPASPFFSLGPVTDHTGRPPAGGPTLIFAPCDPSKALLTQPALSLWRLKNKHRPAIVIAKQQVAAIYNAMPEINEVVMAPERINGPDGLLSFVSRLKNHSFIDSYLLCNRFRARALTSILTIDQRYPFKKISAANSMFGHRSEDYAALLLNLSSVAEVPINLPVPSLRADGKQQQKLLQQCGLQSELFGTAGQLSKLRSHSPIFVVQLANSPNAPRLYERILDICHKRWPCAKVAILKGNEINLHKNSKSSQTSETISDVTINSKLAIISLAAAVITDETLLVQLSDAFRTPVVYLETDIIQPIPRWPSHQGRFAQCSISGDAILRSLEKILRFDSKQQALS